MNDDQRTLTTRQGNPVRDNQNMRTVGERGPTTLENYQFIEKITHFDRERIPERVVHARGTSAHGYFEAYGKIGNEPATKYTRANVLTEGGKRTPLYRALLDRRRQQRQPGDGAGPARLRGEVLHHGRQLGSRGQQFAGLLHPRRDQVPGHDPRLQGRPGDEPPGALALLRLRAAPPGVAAHGHLGEEPVGHPRKLPRDGGVERQHLQARQRRGRRAPGQVLLGAEAGRAQPDQLAGRRDPGAGSRPRDEGPLRGDRAQGLPGVGVLRPAHVGRRSPGAGFRPAGRHEALAGGQVPLAADRPHGAGPATRTTSSPRPSSPHFWHRDEEYGRRVAEGAGIDLEKAKALPPLPGKPAPGERRSAPTYSDGRSEEKAKTNTDGKKAARQPQMAK